MKKQYIQPETIIVMLNGQPVMNNIPIAGESDPGHDGPVNAPEHQYKWDDTESNSDSAWE